MLLISRTSSFLLSVELIPKGNSYHELNHTLCLKLSNDIIISELYVEYTVLGIMGESMMHKHSCWNAGVVEAKENTHMGLEDSEAYTLKHSVL